MKTQWKALLAISGGFYDTPTEAMQILTYIPPIHSTLTKLHRSASIRIPRLPMWSEITMRLPATHILTVQMTQWVPRPRHIPFSRPADSKVTKNSPSPLNQMVANLNPGIERSEPFHSQNMPHSHKLSTLPFTGRLFINPEACPKKEKKSYLANQRIWLCSREGQDTLTVFADGSKTDKAVGWAVMGIHAG